jgi:N-acetylmuramoyl-L-alanine amidase
MANKAEVKEKAETTLEEKIAAADKESSEVVEVIKEEPKIIEEVPVVVEEIIPPPVVKEVVEEVTEKPVPVVVEEVIEKSEPAVVVEEVIEKLVEAPKVMKKTMKVHFRVQFMASTKNIPLDPARFNGLTELSKEPIKNMFRYMHGSANTYARAQLLKENADTKGYPTSYIVAYKDGVRIPTADAIKMLSR